MNPPPPLPLAPRVVQVRLHPDDPPHVSEQVRYRADSSMHPVCPSLRAAARARSLYPCSVCVCVCVCARARARARANVRAHVRAHVLACVRAPTGSAHSLGPLPGTPAFSRPPPPTGLSRGREREAGMEVGREEGGREWRGGPPHAHKHALVQHRTHAPMHTHTHARTRTRARARTHTHTHSGRGTRCSRFAAAGTGPPCPAQSRSAI